MLSKRHSEEVENIKKMFIDCGYDLRKDLNTDFKLSKPNKVKHSLKDAIWDLKDTAVPYVEKNYANPKVVFSNHKYFQGLYSTFFMSRNRVRQWDECGFTVQASGRQAQLYPQAPVMPMVDKKTTHICQGNEHLYRCMTVCQYARL